MNISFFASRTLTWYMARMFLVRSAAVLAALVIVLMALDLLGESGEILAYPGNGDAELWTYVLLRTPQIIQRFLPFAVLLGTLMTFVTLNQNSEIISMKAAGVSAHQILAPLIVASIGVAVGTFAFNERVVARSTATLTAWQDAGYGKVPIDRGIVSDVWVRDGDDPDPRADRARARQGGVAERTSPSMIATAAGWSASSRARARRRWATTGG